MSKVFLEASNDIKNAEIIIRGIPFDGTSSFRGGSREGPDSIRTFSENLETFSPYFKQDIHSIRYADAGDMEIIPGSTLHVHDAIYSDLVTLLDHNARIISLGGEHSISFPIIKALNTKFSDILFIVFDAHADLRVEYGDTPYSHASVVKRISEHLGMDNIICFGQRSFTEEEYNDIGNSLMYSPVPTIIEKKLYNDLDILDPSILPGTGTPEADGWSFRDLMNTLLQFNKCNIIGSDIVELSPCHDKSGISSAAAAKLTREMMLLMKSYSQ